MPKYSLYIAMHNGTPCLLVEIPSMNRFKYVVQQGETFASLKGMYLYYKQNPQETHYNVETYVLPAAYASMQQTA